MRTPRRCSVATIAYAVAYALIAAAYVVAPPARTSRPGVISVARYIDTLGPVWWASFGLVALGLVVAMLLRRGEWLAHSVAAAVIAGYGAAALTSGFLSTNVYGSPLAFVSAATVVQHMTLARTYQTTTATGVHRVP